MQLVHPGALRRGARRLALLCLCASVSQLVAAAPAALQGREPFRALTFEAAKEAARKESLPVLLVFYGPNCDPCRAMDEICFVDPEVRGWLAERCVAIKVPDQDEALAQSYAVRQRPSMILVSDQGKELDRLQGYTEPRHFVDGVNDIVKGRTGLTKARQAVKDHPDDPEAHLGLARALRNRSHLEESLAEFLWVFDQTRGVPEWSQRRGEEIVRELAWFQRSLTGSARPILERRDAAASVLIEGFKPDMPTAELIEASSEVAMLNRALSQTSNSIFTWDVLRKRGVDRAVLEPLFDVPVQNELLNKRRYEDYLFGMGDPLVMVEGRLAEVQALKALAETDKKAKVQLGPEVSRMVNDAGRFYEALIGVERDTDAASLLELILAFEPGSQTWISFLRGAKQAGRPELAASLLERALASVPEGAERARMERTGRMILSR